VGRDIGRRCRICQRIGLGRIGRRRDLLGPSTPVMMGEEGQDSEQLWKLLRISRPPPLRWLPCFFSATIIMEYISQAN